MTNFSHGRDVLIFIEIYLTSVTYFLTIYYRLNSSMVALLLCVDIHFLSCSQRRYTSLLWMDLRIIEIYETLTLEEFLI